MSVRSRISAQLYASRANSAADTRGVGPRREWRDHVKGIDHSVEVGPQPASQGYAGGIAPVPIASGFGEITFEEKALPFCIAMLCCACCRPRRALTITESPPRLTMAATWLSKTVHTAWVADLSSISTVKLMFSPREWAGVLLACFLVVAAALAAEGCSINRIDWDREQNPLLGDHPWLTCSERPQYVSFCRHRRKCSVECAQARRKTT